MSEQLLRNIIVCLGINTFWKCLQIGLVVFAPLVPFEPLETLCVPFPPLNFPTIADAAGPVGGLLLSRGVDMNTEGNSLIGRSKASNSRWKPAALMRVIRSLLPL